MNQAKGYDPPTGGADKISWELYASDLIVPSLTKSLFNFTLAIYTPFLSVVGGHGTVNPTMFLVNDVMIDLFRKTVIDKMYGWNYLQGGVSTSVPLTQQFMLAAMGKSLVTQAMLVGLYYSWAQDPNWFAYMINSAVAQTVHTVAYSHWPCLKNPLTMTCHKGGKP